MIPRKVMKGLAWSVACAVLTLGCSSSPAPARGSGQDANAGEAGADAAPEASAQDAGADALPEASAQEAGDASAQDAGDASAQDAGDAGGQDGGSSCAADPGAPTDVGKFIALPSDKSVFLSWAPPASAAGELILRSTSPVKDCPASGVSYTAGQTIGASTVVFSGDTNQRLDTPLPNGTTYYYRVFAYSSGYHYAGGVADSATPQSAVGPFTDVTIPLAAAPWGIDIEPDGQGGFGLLATTGTWGNIGTVYYSRCKSSCGQASSWTSPVNLGQIDRYRVAKLAIDAQGASHVAIASLTNTTIYRACTSGCSSEPNWSNVTLPNAGEADQLRIAPGGRLWIGGEGQPAELSFCDGGCSTASNWTPVALPHDSYNLADLEFAPVGGTASLLYYTTVSGSYELFLATCSGGCTTSSGWSDAYLTTTHGSAPPASYRFLPDGTGARMLESVFNVTWTYFACDACAPGAPGQTYAFTNTQVYNGLELGITSKGQPRVLTELSSGGNAVMACDYECDSDANWSQTIVAPQSPNTMRVVNDKLVIAYAQGNSVVVRLP